MELVATADIPRDEAPPVDNGSGDYNPDYPGSTEEAPYGYKKDGTPYTRRPRGTGGKVRASVGAMPASDKLAESAAALLASANTLVGISLMAFGMPHTAASLGTANIQFETMARKALAADPALCKKILSTGATGGKAGLVMAYSMLAVNMFPSAKEEISEKRAERQAEREKEYDA